MTTLAQLADRAQNALNDSAAGTWPQATLEEWCLEAIRDYSQHFSRTGNQFINCVAGQHNYDLDAAFQGVLYAWYPFDLDRPAFLRRRSRHHPVFWLSDGYYDVQDRRDAADPAEIWISASPAAGEVINVHYTANYNAGLASHETIEVLADHEPLLIHFVVWKAHAERLATEAQNPDTTIRMLQQMKLAVQATEYTYRQALRLAKRGRAQGLRAAPWQIDGYDRIY